MPPSPSVARIVPKSVYRRKPTRVNDWATRRCSTRRPPGTAAVDQYAAALDQATGRTVAVSNRSRDDSATLDDIVSQVTSHESLRKELGGADVVLVSGGFNDVPLPARPSMSVPAR